MGFKYPIIHFSSGCAMWAMAMQVEPMWAAVAALEGVTTRVSLHLGLRVEGGRTSWAAPPPSHAQHLRIALAAARRSCCALK
jgi:hypothetical protein